MKYDFAHPKFKNGMVIFAEKKPDLLYEFRQAAIRRHYTLRPDMVLYTPDNERLAKVQNYFDILVVTKFDDIGSTKLCSKQDIDRFFREMDESYNYKGEHTMTLTEAKQILKAHNYILERGRPFSDPSNRADFYDPDYYHDYHNEPDSSETEEKCNEYRDNVEAYLKEKYPNVNVKVMSFFDNDGKNYNYECEIDFIFDHKPTHDEIMDCEDIDQNVGENTDDCGLSWDDRGTVVFGIVDGKRINVKGSLPTDNAEYFIVACTLYGSERIPENDGEGDFDEDVDPFADSSDIEY